MAADLLRAGNFVGAARETRNAALAALRGMALLDDSQASQWTETRVVVHALESDREVARLLHGEDRAHVLLRVSVDGATFTAADVESAREVAREIISLTRARAASAAS